MVYRGCVGGSDCFLRDMATLRQTECICWRALVRLKSIGFMVGVVMVMNEVMEMVWAQKVPIVSIRETKVLG